MGKQYEKKITWTIKNFSSLESEEIYSDEFVVGDSKWRLWADPKAEKGFSMSLDVADFESLPCGWQRHAKYRLTVVNKISNILSQQKGQSWFNSMFPCWHFQTMIPHTELVKINGLLVNDEVKIVAEVSVLEVICKSDVLKETLLVHESIDVAGFQVLPSQVESVNNLFEKHPNIASEFRSQNPLLRTTYLTVLLNLLEILYQSPEKLSSDDLFNACSTLSYLKNAGFKLDWLDKKLKEVGETRTQKIEKELKDLKRKFC